jgi:hypothetical protein
VGAGGVEELLGLGDQGPVVAADPLDLQAQHGSLDAGLDQPDEGEDAQDEQGGQDRGHKRVQPSGSLGQEPEGDQPAGHGAQVDRGAAVGFGDGGGAGASLDEVLSHQSAHEGLLP